MKYIKSCLLMLILTVMLMGCDRFEISNVIYPKLTIIGRDVGVVYKLGNLTIADTWEDVSKSKIAFLKEEMEKQDGFADLTFTLYVKYSEGNSNGVFFYYYVNGILFEDYHTIPSVSANLLIANMDSIEGFYLYELNGKIVSEKNGEVIQEEIAKVKAEVKKEDVSNVKDRYKVDDKW